MKVNGRSAQIIYASAEEVIVVVPDELASGPAEFVVTNAEGLSTRAEAIISSAAPGVFTVTGDGRGDAIILDADTLTIGPFDPSNGKLRLSIFATGVIQASHVSVTINAKPTVVESVSSTSFSGLDQINVLAAH